MLKELFFAAVTTGCSPGSSEAEEKSTLDKSIGPKAFLKLKSTINLKLTFMGIKRLL